MVHTDVTSDKYLSLDCISTLGSTLLLMTISQYIVFLIIRSKTYDQRLNLILLITFHHVYSHFRVSVTLQEYKWGFNDLLMAES